MNKSTAVVLVLILALAFALLWFYPWLGLSLLSLKALGVALFWLAVGFVMGHLGAAK